MRMGYKKSSPMWVSHSFREYPERGLNPHAAYTASDFKSDASAIPPSGRVSLPCGEGGTETRFDAYRAEARFARFTTIDRVEVSVPRSLSFD